MSWLHTAPDKDFKPSPKNQSRIENEKENFDAFFNSLEPETEYMLGLFRSSGMVMQSGYGPMPLSWEEIKSWNETLNLNLTSRELTTIKNMSTSYVNQLHLSKDPACVAPAHEVDEDLLELKRSKISDAFKNMPKKTRK